MTVGLILEGLVAVLLVTTVYYCVILNRRLTKLRDGQDEFMSLVVELNEATRRAQNSVEDLKSLSAETGKELEERVAAGRVLADELAMITEAGNNLANRLERQLTGISAVRSPGWGAASRRAAVDLKPEAAFGEVRSARDSGTEPRSETERELLRTLKEVR